MAQCYYVYRSAITGQIVTREYALRHPSVLEKVLWNVSIKNKNIVSYQFKSVFQVLAKVPKNASISEMLTGSV